MLTEPLIQQLHQLRLAGMAAALEQQLSFPDLSDRSFEDRLGIMIQHEFTERATHRLAMRYRVEGPVGLVSRRRKQPSNNRLEAGLEARVLKILRESYADFGPTLAAEKLAERHRIVLSKETVRRLQVSAGLWIPRRLRAAKVQQPRARRACVGELVQIDGCEHRWFEERAPACTTLVFVDDATSRLMAVRFALTESTFGYFEATREYIENHGKPLAFYSDKASIFRVNRALAATGPGLRIPVHAGHQFRSMPGHDSGACRATIPVDAGRGV